ncbi:MAG: phytoene/squalene synthase family protein, partial [Saprospiraceae bacterium]|nr:phytoene/squalene synthase family protein [Saprospiraceae bacterium]
DFQRFSVEDKERIEEDINLDFDAALDGIRRLPTGCRFGVYLAYKYYTQLFVKIKNAPAQRVAQVRFRVSDKRKVYLLFSSAVRHRLDFL